MHVSALGGSSETQNAQFSWGLVTQALFACVISHNRRNSTLPEGKQVFINHTGIAGFSAPAIQTGLLTWGTFKKMGS